jgi:aprataxin
MAFWSKKLLETMKDPNSIVLKTLELVAILDKYPKAKHHYLILPYDDIDTMYDLTSDHIGLIEDMKMLALNVIEVKGQKIENFNIGFHASPSMSRLLLRFYHL